MPNVENKTLEENRESFLKYISSKTVIFAKNVDLLVGNLDTFFEKSQEAFKDLSKEIKHATPEELFCNGDFIKKQLQDFTLVNFGSQKSENQEIEFNTIAQPSFNKQFNLLIDNLEEYHKAKFTNYIFCANDQQAKRFHDIFDDAEQEVHYETVVFPLYKGFVDVDNKLVCYTDHEIFERYHKFRLKNGYAKKQAITLQELTKLEIGDYVTHMDHGIGKFGGLQKIDVQGNKQEAIKLVYGERDILYVSIHSLHKISKFNGKDGNCLLYTSPSPRDRG